MIVKQLHLFLYKKQSPKCQLCVFCVLKALIKSESIRLVRKNFLNNLLGWELNVDVVTMPISPSIRTVK